MLIDVDIDSLDASFPNICSIPATPEADAALAASLRKRQIHPILIRPLGNGYQLIDGFRRVAQAPASGLMKLRAEVREMTDREALEAQVVAKMHRHSLHAVDRWKAAAGMLDAGETVEDAAVALGFSPREVLQMQRLAQLHPRMRDLVVRDMPSVITLRTIALASEAQQLAALKAAGARANDHINWHVITSACIVAEIPMGRAIFERALGAVAYEENLFAEPGAEDQFVTRDVEGFLRAQRAALVEEIAAYARKGQRAQIADWSDQYPYLKLPKGWSYRYTSADKFKPPKGRTGPMAFFAIAQSSHNIGKIVRLLADPPAQLANRPAAETNDDGVADVETVAQPLEIEKPALTQRGLQMIAQAKTDALHEMLRGVGPSLDIYQLAAFLVVSLTSRNVRITTDRSWNHVDFHDLIERLVQPDGGIVHPIDIAAIASEALARILHIDDPVASTGSGAPAEWVGRTIGAEVALPRFDTAEFLATLSRGELTTLAHRVDISVPSKVSALRETLVGNAPEFRPAAFGAPGPTPATDDLADKEQAA